MAASGIQEHNEARRKAMQMERRAYINSQLMKGVLADNENNYNTHDNTYDLQVEHYRVCGSPPDEPKGHDPRSVDQQRRRQIQNQQTYEYSAKLPGRYSSIDYKQQW